MIHIKPENKSKIECWWWIIAWNPSSLFRKSSQFSKRNSRRRNFEQKYQEQEEVNKPKLSKPELTHQSNETTIWIWTSSVWLLLRSAEYACLLSVIFLCLYFASLERLAHSYSLCRVIPLTTSLDCDHRKKNSLVDQTPYRFIVSEHFFLPSLSLSLSLSFT